MGTFGKANYGNLNVTLIGGKNDVTNQDQLNPNQSLMGSYDSEYYVANKGTFYTADVGYSFKMLSKSETLRRTLCTAITIKIRTV